MKQLALLLPSKLAQAPESDVSLAASIVAGYSALWHPHLLDGAHFLPRIADVANPPAGDERIFLAPKSVFESADALIQSELTAPGTKLLRIDSESPDDVFGALARECELPDGDASLLADFHAVGYAYLGMQIFLRNLGYPEKLEEQLVWDEIQSAIEHARSGDVESARNGLASACDVLSGNRQSAYPATINWVDVALTRADNLSAVTDRLQIPAKVNLLLASRELESLTDQQITKLKHDITNQSAEVLTGRCTDRPILLLPYCSVVWELERSLKTYREKLGKDADCFAGRASSMFADLPQLLMKMNVRYALHAAFDGGRVPVLRGPKLHWTSSDGSVAEALCRSAIDAGPSAGGLKLFARLAASCLEDRSPTLLLTHWIDRVAPWYHHLLRIAGHADVFGKFETFSEYFLNASLPETSTITRQEEYGVPIPTSANPISRWRDHHRRRHQFDAGRSLLALASMADGAPGPDSTEAVDRLEFDEDHASVPTEDWRRNAGERLKASVCPPTEPAHPGYLIVNPCSFPRRVGVTLEGIDPSLTTDSVVRAVDPITGGADLVVDLPGWGYAWIPKTPLPKSGTSDEPSNEDKPLEKLVHRHRIRNAQVELEIDSKTGGLRGIWPRRNLYSRLGCQLIHSNGLPARATSVETTHDGRVRGEVTARGVLLGPTRRDERGQFVVRYQLWRGRPILRIDVDIELARELEGSPEENYVALRWAWPDEKSVILTSSGPTMQSNYTEELLATEFLEVREQSLATNILTAGVPFHRRRSARIADSLLMVPGEQSRSFTFWVGIEPADPFRLAQAESWPVLVQPTDHRPVGGESTGWWAKLSGDAVLAITSVVEPGDAPRIRLRVAETGGSSARAELQFQRPVTDSLLTTFVGETIYDLHLEDDQLPIHFSGFEIQQIEATLAADQPSQDAAHT